MSIYGLMKVQKDVLVCARKKKKKKKSRLSAFISRLNTIKRRRGEINTLCRSNEKSKSVQSLGQAGSRYATLPLITVFSLIASICIFFFIRDWDTTRSLFLSSRSSTNWPSISLVAWKSLIFWRTWLSDAYRSRMFFSVKAKFPLS